MNRYERVVRILNDSIPGPDVGIAADDAFWRGLKRDGFVTAKVFNFDWVVVGDGTPSNLVNAPKGEGPFGTNLPNPPACASAPRRPFGLDPVSPRDTSFIEHWIDDGCPDDTAPPQNALTWRPVSAPAAT